MIDLVWLGSEPEPHSSWTLGRVHVTRPEPGALRELVDAELPGSTAEAWLFWDAALGAPDEEVMRAALATRGDLWHGGLRLGLSGAPAMLDFVAPTWMLNCDPSPDLVATSWRVSLRACLVRRDLLGALGGPDAGYRSLAGAGLDLGRRALKVGAVPRAWPAMVSRPGDREGGVPPEDQTRFIAAHHGRKWARWALLRAATSGMIDHKELVSCLVTLGARPTAQPPAGPYRKAATVPLPEQPSVAVLIPTLQRYPYLRRLLENLREQTIPAREIVIVDQSPADERDLAIAADFADLPLRILYRDVAGQCSSRNAGLASITSDYVLFADDDTEIPKEFIESHLRNLFDSGSDVSSGVIRELNAPGWQPDLGPRRVSDVFPMGNTLIRSELLRRTGLLDLAYDRGVRADGDFGMRAYLTGAVMTLDPAIEVLHHRAPRGGLRAHGARVITYATSRNDPAERHLPSRTEIYLAKRYFSARQVKEMLHIRALGTLSIRGGLVRRFRKVAHGLRMLPSTWQAIRSASADADAMLNDFPQIGRLEGADRR